MKTNYANMYFIKYMLFIWMSKSENSKPKEYYAQVIMFLIFFYQIQITIKFFKIMKKITKLNNIEHQTNYFYF